MCHKGRTDTANASVGTLAQVVIFNLAGDLRVHSVWGSPCWGRVEWGESQLRDQISRLQVFLCQAQCCNPTVPFPLNWSKVKTQTFTVAFRDTSPVPKFSFPSL